MTRPYTERKQQEDGPHAYNWHTEQERRRAEKRRLSCKHERVISFCACCKVNMDTLKPVSGKEWKDRKANIDIS
jgi:hypothetical protein